jgi:hypothetical protein
METPQPVNVNNPALLALLRNAKKIMSKVENNDFTTGHVDGRALTEEGVAELQSEGVRRPAAASSINESADYTEEQVRNSKLPPAIKEAMIKNKIPKVTMASSSFSLEDVSDLIEKPMGFPKTPVTKRVVNENILSNNSDMISISKTELKSMINESLAQFFKTSYDKALTEDAIKRTIQMLIKEGKISVKQK